MIERKRLSAVTGCARGDSGIQKTSNADTIRLTNFNLMDILCKKDVINKVPEQVVSRCFKCKHNHPKYRMWLADGEWLCSYHYWKLQEVKSRISSLAF